MEGKEMKSNEPGKESLSFFLRPPVSKEEVDAAAPRIQNVINTAYSIYEAGGVEGLMKYISDQSAKNGKDRNALGEAEDSDGDSDEIENAKITGDARPYQIAMVERAKKHNTIVQLRTGLGKTLIAILTIRHFSHQYKGFNSNGHAKQTWFLVPSVALAVQQTQTLRVNLPFKVATACHTAGKSEKARSEMSVADILVLTHGSAIELLQHYGDIFYLSRVNLIVVDECHHATKKHNYVNIFNLFYHPLPKDSRPRVLGLTATPIINIPKKISEEGLEAKLKSLEATLDSRVVGFSTLGLSMEESGVINNNVKEMSIIYENPPTDTSTFPTHCGIGLHNSRLKEFDQLLYLLEEYGPVVVWQYAEVLIKEISLNYYEKETMEEFSVVKNHLQTIRDHCRNASQNNGGKTTKLAKLEKLLSELYRTGFDDTMGIVFVQRRISALSLKHYFSSMLHSHSEANEEKSKSNNKNIIRSGLLTRKTTHTFKYLSSVQKISNEQEEDAHREWLHTVQDARAVLNSLRNRDINLLFATSVVEEGVDIDACSFVIVLDELQTTKTYVQMKGRARVLDANFFVFENTHIDSQRAPLTLSDANKIDSRLSSYLGTRNQIGTDEARDFTDSTNIFPNLFSEDSKTSLSALEEKAVIDGKYHAPNGMVSLTSSKSLINRYCSCIPMDLHARSSRATMKPYLPVYENFILVLPSHLPSNIRNVFLPKKYVTNSKKMNESYLALIACVRLHEHNVLNDRLLPLKRADIQKKLRESALSTLKRVPVHLYEATSQQVSKEKEVFIYPLVQRGSIFQQNHSVLNGNRILCILSLTPLDSGCCLSLNLTHRQLGPVHCSIGPLVKTSVSPNQWKTCQLFYTTLMNSRWRRRTGRAQFQLSETRKSLFPPYIVSYLTDCHHLDWEYMEKIICEYNRSDSEKKEAARNWKAQTPRLFAPLYDPNNTYIAYQVEQTQNCASPFPAKDSAFESFRDYFLKQWSFNVSRNGTLIHVQRCWELPTKVSEVKDNSGQDCQIDGKGDEGGFCKGLVSILLPQEACMEAPIADADLFLQSILLPQILYELERIETVHRFILHCSRWSKLYSCLQMMKLEDVIIAMTAKSCALGEICYDKLEYLGDAVLKLIHTDALINSKDGELRRWFHCLHEGDLSELRTVMGCNSRLRLIAESAGFDLFILTTPLGRGTWLPSGLETFFVDNEGNILKNTGHSHHYFAPSGKVIADVVESLLGLIYLHCGYDAATDVAIELSISTPRSTESFHHMNPSDNFQIDENLIIDAKRFLGVEKFHDTNFVMEACTHPTKTGLTNYQRLEWIGDGVLCLAAREWVYLNFKSSFSVKDMVTIETVLICNETLSMMAYSSGLHRYISHCDSTLPGRLESYAFQIEQQQKGLWSTDPPKVLADIVEALIGVAHIEGGLAQGQQAARNVLGTMLRSIHKHFSQSGNKYEQMLSITHPAQAVMEVCPAVKIRGYNIIDYKNKSSSPIWFGNSWNYCSENEMSYGEVGHTSYFGLNLCSVGHKKSQNVAKKRSGSLLFCVLNESKDLKSKLEIMTNALTEHES